MITAICCFSAAFGQQNREGALALSNDPAPKVEIFPNPATEFVRVKMENTDHRSLRVSVLNIIGNPVKVEVEQQEEQIILSIKDLPAGYYLISLKSEESLFRGTYKFLKR
ncbi:MAG TPA: T9SS type A sorting domain-containing protein [Cyclobacteriaceae bacterium]|nr:T9SS type A sorting domain-containing protein [Cyclobacteriaceae bacterium]